MGIINLAEFERSHQGPSAENPFLDDSTSSDTQNKKLVLHLRPGFAQSKKFSRSTAFDETQHWYSAPAPEVRKLPRLKMQADHTVAQEVINVSSEASSQRTLKTEKTTATLESKPILIESDDTATAPAVLKIEDPVEPFAKKEEDDGAFADTSTSQVSEVLDDSRESHVSSDSESSESSSDEEIVVPPSVRAEMTDLELSFPGLGSKYLLTEKIGEGTFSSVYKAIDLQGVSQRNSGQMMWKSPPAKLRNGKHRHHHKKHKVSQPVVALKRIYVTSSPQRIYNELQLLHSLVGCRNVAPLLDAIRFEDQVIAVLPYCKHNDFRDYYRDMPMPGIRAYMRELFEALRFVHHKHIIHRDIKPTNFLYNPFTRRGVLVDFGLAEKELEPEASLCPCVNGGLRSDEVAPANMIPSGGYLKDDPRSGRRANRAGTRGFRAPEVLFKCANQTCKIDMWSAGVMLLTLLSRRFPFFNSTDDVDALAEITAIFGLEPMRQCAELHGLGFECNLPDAENNWSLGETIYYAVEADAKANDTFADDSPSWEVLVAMRRDGTFKGGSLGAEYAEALELLDACLKLDFRERFSADKALQMDFFTKHSGRNTDEVILD